MFTVFLPSLGFRGNRSPYLWWFYKFLSEFGVQAGYICGDEYLLDPKLHLANGRNEASNEVARYYKYQIPDIGLLARLRQADIAPDVWRAMEQRFPDNPLEAFRHFCLVEDSVLKEALVQAFDHLESVGEAIEVVVTCVNCATLRRLCKERGLPLLHIEIGPLRAPQYLQTAYFDFSGVNGATEARSRFDAMGMTESGAWDRLESLRSLFTVDVRPPREFPPVDLGIGLQIEDDSNLICYSNGYSSLALINNAKRLLAEGQVTAPVLVRGHPGSMFALKDVPRGMNIDRSESAVEFLLQCREIHTVNSSLAVESLLLGHKATVYGDCPFSFCIDAHTRLCNESAFSFFLLNYLVPSNLATSSDYIRWRLGRPTEEAIRKAHLEFYMHEKNKLLEARVAELERILADRDRQIAQLKSWTCWYLTYPLRLAVRRLLRWFGSGNDPRG